MRPQFVSNEESGETNEELGEKFKMYGNSKSVLEIFPQILH